MRRTERVTPLEDGRLRCEVCQWRCALAVGETGRCQVRRRTDEGIMVEQDGLISAAQVGPVEEMRLWHLLPGTNVLALGGWGYAFPADQQRGQYGSIPTDPAKQRYLASERAAQFALDRLCRGIVWGFSDPSVSLEYVHELLQFARASSRYTALVTTGYGTPEALADLGHYLDAVSLDLRGMTDAAYQRLAGVADWRGVLEFASRARTEWNCHIEVTTRLHPGVNDSPPELQAMAEWIVQALGPDTPWHTLPGDAGVAAAGAVQRARQIGHSVGLHFIYGADREQPTVCYQCGQVKIDRTGSSIRVLRLDDGGCANCGQNLDIRTSIFKR